jgi:hypothetical protein
MENIRNTRKIWKVISRGQVLSGEYHADFKNPLPKNYAEDSSHFFPSPRIQSVSPGYLTEGSTAATLKVQGTGLIPYSFVRWNGEKLKTEFVSENELVARVPKEFLRGGTHSVTVENPDFAWGTIFARGASDLVHLGMRDNISNESLVLVRHAPKAAPSALRR